MFKKQNREKEKKLLDGIKAVWENNHAEEITESYNKMIEILGGLDIYSANMLVNLLYYQTMLKTYQKTVGIKEIGGEK